MLDARVGLLTVIIFGLVHCMPPADPTPEPDTQVSVDVPMVDTNMPEPDTTPEPDTAPEPDTTPAPDTQPPPDETAPEWGEEAMLQALAVVEDSLTLTWSQATDPSDVTAYLVYQDDVLVTKLAANYQSIQINQLSPATTYVYRVEAEDGAGNVSTTGPTLTVATDDKTPPTWTAESSVSATDVTASTVTLTWTGAADNVAVTAYRVYRDNIEVGTTDAATLSHTVEGLLPWQVYTFRVEAEDAHGNLSSDGPWADVTTLDDTSPVWGVEASLVASQIKPTSCYLGWDMAMDDVAVTSYQVLQDKVEIAMLDGDTTWLKVEGLTPWTVFNFEVIAWDASGNATQMPLATTVFTPDESAPTWPEGSVILASNATNDSVTIGWTAAEDDVGVTSYQVYQDNVQVAVVDGSTLSAWVTDLEADTTYVFRVEAADNSGNLSFGGPTMTLDLNDKTPPQWPDDAVVTATDMGSKWITLNWSAATDNVNVAGYQIMESGDVVASVGPGETSATVMGLTPNTSYTFTLLAVDGAGNISDMGPSVTAATTDYEDPVWPEDATLTASDILSDAVTLAWSALDPAEQIASYEIYQDDALITTVDAPAMSVTVTGLEAVTTYTFRVEAIGPTGKTSTTGPATDVTTSDLAPPTWDPAAALTVSNVTESGLTLTWPPLHDTQAVASYQVHQDGQLVATVNAPSNSYAATGLNGGTAYTFKIEAVGPTGLVSTNGPSATGSTVDLTGPTWPDGAEIKLFEATETSANINWTAATDNVAVTGYEIFVDGQSVATVAGDVTNYVVTGLNPATTYTISVEATDGAGNATTDGPSLDVTTSNEAVAVGDQEVMDALADKCTTCHGGWFNSMESFQSMVVTNAAFITPGDPDGSLLMNYLEEKGPGSGQMPPAFFGPSYMAMDQAGETQLSIQQIRDWISGM